MSYNAERHHRRSIRLNGYDYAQAGAYFVTICTQDRACLFGEIIEGSMVLNDAGQAIDAAWRAMSGYSPGVLVDEFIVMPNHVHGIIGIANVRAPLVGAPDERVNDDDSACGDGVNDDSACGDGVNDDSACGDGVNDDSARGDGVNDDSARGDGVNDDSACGDGVRKRAGTRPAPTTTLGGIVGAFKSRSTVLYARGVRNGRWPAYRGRLWQRNYFEHIIRNDESLKRIRQYIRDNPARWALDRENPDALDAEIAKDLSELGAML